MESIIVNAGDSYSLSFTFNDSIGNPVNLTGGIVVFTVKKNKEDSDDDSYIRKVLSNFGGVGDDPINGVCVIELSSSDSRIRRGAYFYDVQLKDSSDRVQSSEVGKFIVNQDISIGIS